MAHEAQTRYSDLVLAKLRNELVLSDGLVQRLRGRSYFRFCKDPGT